MQAGLDPRMLKSFRRGKSLLWLPINAFVNSVKTSQAKSTIGIGDKVYVVQKTKRTLGEVVKVNIKKAIVNMPQGRYNVPLSMLEKA